MTDPQSILAETADRDGHQIVLLARIWEHKITRNHPELAGHLDAVLDSVARPDHVEPDTIPERSRFYRRDTGPSRWLRTSRLVSRNTRAQRAELLAAYLGVFEGHDAAGRAPADQAQALLAPAPGASAA